MTGIYVSLMEFARYSPVRLYLQCILGHSGRLLELCLPSRRHSLRPGERRSPGREVGEHARPLAEHRHVGLEREKC